jgi:4-amino-4-deoxychorismate lyase
MNEDRLKKINLKGRVANLVRNPQVFFETIRVENNCLHHLNYHNARMNATRKNMIQISEPLFLENEITLPETLDQGIHKCRVIYAESILQIEFEAYKKKSIRSLQPANGSSIHYPFKSVNRSALNTLFENRTKGDDVIIVKHGNVTDTSYANVAFWDGQTWLTPDQPLHAGTTRSRLLEEGKITLADIRVETLWNYEKVWIFNAMMQTILPVNTNTILKE